MASRVGLIRSCKAVVSVSVLLVTVIFLQSGCNRAVKETNVLTIDQQLSLYPETHILKGSSRFSVSPVKQDTFYFTLHSDLALQSVEVNGTSVKPVAYGSGEEMKPHLKRLGKPVDDGESREHMALYGLPVTGQESAGDTLELLFSYEGVIFDAVSVPEFSRWQIADETSGLIEERGAFLTPWTRYYPAFLYQEKPITFTTEISIPENWNAIAEGKILEETAGKIKYFSEHPIDGCYLVAGPYHYQGVKSNGVQVGMYYYDGSEDLADRYIQASAQYLEKYRKLLGEYGFSRFSVVENWFPTGYGMPTYTLLGSSVLRLPFIIYTSLGHEICHNWWGNGVYVDYDSGNWCEGLTVYCADYHYKVESGPADARQYRMETDRDYTEYVVRGDAKDFPLRKFTERTTAGSRTIGYGKSMMVFHMLNRMLGDDIFWDGLREFYQSHQFQFASWDDFIRFYEEKSDISLKTFKHQWIDREGAPQLALEHVTAEKVVNEYRVEFDLRQVQAGAPYHLRVPVRFTYDDSTSEERELDDVRSELYHARIMTAQRPVRLAIDPDFHIFRVLAVEETPPTLAGFFGDESPSFVIHSDNKKMRDAYREFTKAWTKGDMSRVFDSSENLPEDLYSHAVMVLGETEKVERDGDGWVFNGQKLEGENLSVIYAHRDPNNMNITHLTLWSESPGSLGGLARKLPHYGKYGYLAFSSGQNIRKGQWPVQDSPLSAEINIIP